jgi:hypothetical protein
MRIAASAVPTDDDEIEGKLITNDSSNNIYTPHATPPTTVGEPRSSLFDTPLRCIAASRHPGRIACHRGFRSLAVFFESGIVLANGFH